MANGAVLFLEKLSPALNQIDSSSGALGNATYAVVQELVPLISRAPVDTAVRMMWLDRLFEAIQEDDPPYIEHLGDHWGDMPALWLDGPGTITAFPLYGTGTAELCTARAASRS